MAADLIFFCMHFNWPLWPHFRVNILLNFLHDNNGLTFMNKVYTAQQLKLQYLVIIFYKYIPVTTNVTLNHISACKTNMDARNQCAGIILISARVACKFVIRLYELNVQLQSIYYIYIPTNIIILLNIKRSVYCQYG